MRSLINWLKVPTKLPKAPTWTMVFAFGALWNALISRSLFGTIFCVVIGSSIYLIDRFVDKKVIKK